MFSAGTPQSLRGQYTIFMNGTYQKNLMKIIHQLGYVETIRGRNGGIRLGKDPKEINFGEVVSKIEEDFYIVECFKVGGSYCVLTQLVS